MLRSFRVLPLLSLALLSAAASTVSAQALPENINPNQINGALITTMFKGGEHLNDLAWPLITQGADQCKKPELRAGFKFFDVPNADKAMRATIEQSLGIVLGASVDHVIPGSPLDVAGLKSGDTVVSIDGKPVATGKNAAEKSNELLAAALGKAGASGVFAMTVARAGETIAISATPVVACDLDVDGITTMGSMFSTGRKGALEVDPAAMDNAETDRDRQIILAHAIGHHIAGHVATRSGLKFAGGLLDKAAGFAGIPTNNLFQAAGAVATRGGDEIEADAVSLTLLKRIGIEPSETVAFWNHDADEVRANRLANFFGSHPMTTKRLEKLQAAAAALGDDVEQTVAALTAAQRADL